MINFPVLKRVKVSNFAMYAGTDAKPGLDHSLSQASTSSSVSMA